jgi:hypothetical protein
MATIFELREQIRKERNLIENEKDFQKLDVERRGLEKELKELRFNRKYGGVDKTFKGAVEGTKTAFNRIGKEVGKLQDNQNKQDRQEKAIRKKGYVPRLSERRGLFR